jgi:hypothetical protein
VALTAWLLPSTTDRAASGGRDGCNETRRLPKEDHGPTQAGRAKEDHGPAEAEAEKAAGSEDSMIRDERDGLANSGKEPSIGQRLDAQGDKIREAAKWVVGSFAAVGAALIAGSQLSSIGKIPHGFRGSSAGAAPTSCHMGNPPKK